MLRPDHDIDPFKVSSPWVFLGRMLVFVLIVSLVVVILNRQIWAAFLANPGLNALIIFVLLVGILLSNVALALVRYGRRRRSETAVLSVRTSP